MTKAAVHILLVSDQAAPSLLPALDPTLKPAEAVLMVSGKMQARADALETVLHEAGVKTTRVALDDKAEKRLAGALRIERVCGAELARLDEKIRNWVGR